MRNIFLILFFLMCINAGQAQAMIKEPEQTTTESSLPNMPKDIKVMIVKTITESESFEQAIKNLKNLTLVNKEFNRLINDPKFTEFIIDELTRKLMVDARTSPIIRPHDYYKIKAALFLNTPQAREWLRAQIKKHHGHHGQWTDAELLIFDLGIEGDQQKIQILYKLGLTPPPPMFVHFTDEPPIDQPDPFYFWQQTYPE